MSLNSRHSQSIKIIIFNVSNYCTPLCRSNEPEETPLASTVTAEIENNNSVSVMHCSLINAHYFISTKLEVIIMCILCSRKIERQKLKSQNWRILRKSKKLRRCVKHRHILKQQVVKVTQWELMVLVKFLLTSIKYHFFCRHNC